MKFDKHLYLLEEQSNLRCQNLLITLFCFLDLKQIQNHTKFNVDKIIEDQKYYHLNSRAMAKHCIH